MQMIFQDFIDYLPLARGPTPQDESRLLALLNELKPVLGPLLETVGGALVVGWGYFLSAYAVAKEYITKPQFIPSVMIISSVTALMYRKGKGVANLRPKSGEAGWKGVLPLSVLFCGVLLFALTLWNNKTRLDSKVSSLEAAIYCCKG